MGNRMETVKGGRQIMKWNERLFWWIVEKIFHHPKNMVFPRHLYMLRGVLMPCQWLRWRLYNSWPVSYDASTDTFTIYGKKYTSDLFRSFADDGIALNTWFQLIRRDDDAVTIERIYPRIVTVDADVCKLSGIIELPRPEEYYIFVKKTPEERSGS